MGRRHRQGCAGLLGVGLWLVLASATASGLYQVSTIHALLEGVYDGDVTAGDLKRHGDFGLGTFDRVDGEMIVHQGHVYQVLASGEVRTPPDSARTPFAAVHEFQPDLTLSLDRPIRSFDELKRWIDSRLPSPNLMYGVRIRGRFEHVKTRSVPPAEKPYPPLVEIVKRQRTFERDGVNGVLLGYHLPEYMAQINVPGYHLHFLSEDLAFGGHLLECRLRAATVEIDALDALEVQLLRTSAFLDRSLGGFSSSDLDRVERGTRAGH